MKIKVRKNLGLGLVAASFFFFFNPDIIVIDVLPDFLGYLLLCIGLTQLSDLNETLGEALKSFKRMIFVSLAKLISIFVLFGFVTENERPMSMLLLAFVFAVLDLIFLVPAYSKLFDGLVYLGTRNEGTAVFKSSCKGITMLFLFVKSCLTTLPEMTALTTSYYNDNASATVELYEFVGLFRIASIIIVAIIGIIWLIKVEKFFIGILRDKSFIETLTNKYQNEILPKTSLFVRRRVKTCFMLSGIACFLAVDMYIDNFNYIPDALCAIFFIIAVLFLSGIVNDRWKLFLSAGLYTAISAFSSFCAISFNSAHTIGQIYRDEGAYNSYLLMVGMTVAEAILFVTVIIFMFKLILQLIMQHTGFTIDDDNGNNKEQIAEMQRGLKIKLLITFCLAVFVAISGIMYDIMLQSHELIGEIMWIIDFLIAFVFAIFYIKTVNDVYDQIETKYMLN